MLRWLKTKCCQLLANELSTYGLLTLFQKGTGLLMLPYTTRQLTLAEYGLLESVMLLLTLCSLLELSAGAMPRFHGQQKKQERSSLLTSALAINTAFGMPIAFIAGGLLLLPTPLFEQLSLLQTGLVVLIIWFMLMLQPLYMWLRLELRARHYAIAVVIQTLLQVLISITGLEQGLGITAVLMASACAHAAALLLAYAFCSRSMCWQLNLKLCQQSLSYQWCLILASLALFVLHGVDRIVLGMWIGPETLARYGVMIRVLEVLALVFGITEQWWQARRFRVLKTQGQAAVVSVHQALLWLLILLLLMAWLTIPTLFQLILPQTYHVALQWLPMMLCGLGFKLATSVIDFGCYLQERPIWLVQINAASAVLAAILYLWLIPSYGVFGGLVATNLLFAVRFYLFYVLSQRLCSLPYQYGLLLPTALSFTALMWLPLPELLRMAMGGSLLLLLLLRFANCERHTLFNSST